jgi:L-ascorbate metabolism protein UlaG (beta-lactamase superfamily)
VSVTLVRHATLLLEVAGKRILVDPMLRAAGSTPPIEGTPNPVRNPLVELPLASEEVVAGIDGCIVTHLHADHFDDAAAVLLPPGMPVLTQPASAAALRERGLTAVTDEASGWLGLEVARTSGRHGTGELADRLGPVSGFVVEGVYVAGDTVWCGDVAEALASHRPHTVVVNAGGARFLEGDPITMTVEDVRRVREATDAEVVVVHLEAINHCLEPRSAYAGLGVRVPRDGETV